VFYLVSVFERRDFSNHKTNDPYFTANKNQKLDGRVDLSVNYDIIHLVEVFFG